jgi:prepilin-type processing-associated H-X9-DG protein
MIENLTKSQEISPSMSGAVDPERPVGRHAHRCMAGFADGHAKALKVSEIGLQFFPGKTGSGQTATSLEWLGGNNLFTGIL